MLRIALWGCSVQAILELRRCTVKHYYPYEGVMYVKVPEEGRCFVMHE